ncbi:MAG: excisionase [endosymbiont of Galathealinum brachiosum]|uniref:Excisionase n=1 Tax=endosymbiont of Galathealinum brachiosum TaxID=2200906 RepID=A0A370DJM9_9GAMM|nr:MAG: excisionase [endosymbiont of Galathealinum brachiosum]
MSGKEKNYYTSREAAELLGVAVSTIQLWTSNGSLSAWTTDGGHRRIARISVEEMLNEQKAATAGKSAPEHKLSVVIVEDNEQQLRLYIKQFESWGINAQVVTARDGYQGLVKIGNTIPDIIITDLKMPNMDGFQMVRALQVMPELQDSLIIVITGLRGDEVEEKGGLPESVHQLTKPVPYKELEALVREKLK